MLLPLAIISLFVAQVSADAPIRRQAPVNAKTAEALEPLLVNLPDTFADLPDRWKIPGLVEALSMYFVLADPETEASVKATCAVALAYVLNPFDVLPDEIPLFGQLDDLSVLLYTFHTVLDAVQQKHLDLASRWLAEHGFPAVQFFTVAEIRTFSDGLGLYRSVRSYLNSKRKALAATLPVGISAVDTAVR